MAAYVLDMNDSELRIARIGGEAHDVVAQSMGFALIEDRVIRFGQAALQLFRLHPRQVNNQFWNRLSTDPLPSRGPNTANHADLVYRHFQELVRDGAITGDDEFVIATPGTTTNEQLGLLLGIALTRTDGLARQRVDEIAELGLTNLLDAWVNVIADRFVRDARFDPLSIASTDQQVYNQLYAWLQDPARPRDFSIDIDHRGALRHTEMNIETLIDRVTPRYRMLDRHAEAATVFLSHRAARLPGLTEHLAPRAARVVLLDRMDLFRGVAAHQSLIRSDPQSLRLITRL
ncbi:MAG: hypothetical protein NT024_03115, partial [Proteobacteria bacterium]|nr:hypothetical protein [Pseudomonadota bacterium]